MNKKIKLSLLGVLFASSTLAIIMPIVSCSSVTVTKGITLTVKKGTNEQLTAIGSAIAGVAKSGTSNNTTVLNSNEFTAGLAATYTGAVKTAIDSYFTFNDGLSDLTTSDLIESITLTGEYPSAGNADINVKLVVKLKDGWIAPEADLTINAIKIGQTASPPPSATTLTVTKGTSAQLTAIGIAIAAVGKTGTNNNTTILTNTEYNNALRATYTGAVKTAIDAYFTFTNGSTPVADEDAIESITLTGTYPNTPNTDMNVKLVITLKTGYTATTTDLTINAVKIGQTITSLNVTLVAERLAPLGVAFAKIGNPSAINNTSAISEIQYDRILAANYNSPGIKAAIDAYFTFSVNGTSETNVIESISIDGNYTSSGASLITVTVRLKSQYTTTQMNILNNAIVQVGINSAFK